MEIPKHRKRTVVRTMVGVGLLMLVAVAVLNACVVPTVVPPADATAAAESGENVKATVDAAIALAVRATLTAVSPEDESAANTGESGEEAVAAAPTTVDPPPATVEPAAGEATTLLITPTPDRSAEIMDIILQNTRHFRGNPDADVVIVEFSDFL